MVYVGIDLHRQRSHVAVVDERGEQQLGPDGQVVGAERGFQPRLVGRERRERQVGQARALEAADAVFDDRVGAVAGLQGGQIVIGLIGDEALEAVPVDVGERELGAGVRALATDDQARALRPGVERDVAGQLGHPGALARAAPSALIAGRHAASGRARIASRTRASMA